VPERGRNGRTFRAQSFDGTADHQLAESRPGPIRFWSTGRATIICRAPCKASKRWENGSASPLTRRLARPFWSNHAKPRPGAGHDGESRIRTSALPSRDAPEDQACAPDDRANQTGVQPRGGRRDRRDQCPRWRLPRESTWWWPDRRFSITGKESSPNGTAAGRNTALIGKDVVQLAMIGLDRCQVCGCWNQRRRLALAGGYCHDDRRTGNNRVQTAQAQSMSLHGSADVRVPT
jgi:hypothetical protein